MKKFLAVFTVFVYLVPAALYAINKYNEYHGFSSSLTFFMSFVAPVMLMVIVCIMASVNIIAALLSFVRSRFLSFRTILVFKLLLVPFYAVNFVFWLFLSTFFFTAFFTWPLLPFIISYTYFTLLGTSAFNIVKLIKLCADKKIPVKKAVVHSLLQLVFVLDMASTIYLSVKQEKLETM